MPAPSAPFLPANLPLIQRRGLMLVLSSPSGAGKSTLCRRLLADDANIAMSVSVTTRAPRPGEVDGQDYHFISDDAFARMVAEGALLEHARVLGGKHQYGTPRAPVEAALARGQDVLFDIDWQGTQQLAQNARHDLVSVFILPPSLGELESRLRGRAQDSAAEVARRMAEASAEMSHWREYDYQIVNDALDRAEMAVRAILVAERLRRDRQIGLHDFVNRLRGQD